MRAAKAPTTDQSPLARDGRSKVSAANTFLDSWILKAEDAQHAPSITVVTAQRWPGVGYQNWKPAIASYSWGIDGAKITDPDGNPGLTFGLFSWFSDRGQDVSNPPPDIGQQFISSEMDQAVLQLFSVPPVVVINLKSLTWGDEWTSETETFDVPSQQLVFTGIPGAGPGAPPAIMIVSLADTGDFGWL
jgi:hypothetical protein